MQFVLFGAGRKGEEALGYLGTKHITYFCDNQFAGDTEELRYGIPIISFPKLVELQKECVVIVSVGNNYISEICEQLEAVDIQDYFIYEELKKTNLLGKEPDKFFLELQNKETRNIMFRNYYKFLFSITKKQLEFLKSHSDITTLKPAQGVLRKRQYDLLDFVRMFLDDIAKLEIKPFLVFGNLVGAVRHQGFVPWDDDFDLGLIRSEYEKLMKFANEKCVVGIRCDINHVEIAGRCFNWDEVYQLYPDQYIFVINAEMTQVYRGTSAAKYIGMDLWVYDFYKNDYTITEHVTYLEQLSAKKRKIKSEKDIVLFLQKEIEHNPMISMEKTKYFYPGIDNCGGYVGMKKCDRWIPTEDIFPLQKVKYEHTMLWAPKNMETLLNYDYSNFMEFPYDVGIASHAIGWEGQSLK